ncbi:MAG: substrate-binding domain-containing protein [Hyphomicrobiaceae bacterium]
MGLRARIIAWGMVLGIWSATASVAGADEVRILRSDGAEVVGALTSFEDGVYVVQTPAGEIRIEAGKVAKLEMLDVSKTLGAEAGRPDATAGDPPPMRSQSDLSGGTLSLSGSRALGEMAVRHLIEGYALRNGASKPVWGQRDGGKDRTFVAQTGKDKVFSAEVRLRGTAGGVEDLISGAAEIAMLERPMTADEAKRVAGAGLGDPLQPDQETVVGPSAVMVLVHPSNPVKRLSMVQLADVFAGRIRNWNEIGGANRRIQVLVPHPGSALFDAVKSGLGKDLDIMPSARRLGSSLETADLAGADPAAIGLAHSDYRGNATALSLSSSCGLLHEPSEFEIASEAYPFGSRLVLYATNKASKQVKDFVAYARSSEAQRLLQEKGFVSLTPVLAAKGAVRFDRTSAAKMTGASSRFADVVGAFVENAARLSLTFRFNGQSGALDARALSDLDRLVAYEKSGALANRTLALVGYWNSTGDFTDDVNQSKARAVVVADALKLKGLNIERLFGFGPLLPVECDGLGGVNRNRRVEVWIE